MGEGPRQRPGTARGRASRPWHADCSPSRQGQATAPRGAAAGRLNAPVQRTARPVAPAPRGLARSCGRSCRRAWCLEGERIVREGANVTAITASRLSFGGVRTAKRPPALPAAASRVTGVALAAALLGTVAPGGPARAADNPVVVENRNPGNPASEWDVGAGSTAIQG